MFATIYDPTSNGYAHCCIHYSESHAKFGAQNIHDFLLEVKYLNIPVFDITPVNSVIGLSLENITERGGIQLHI